VHNDGSVWAGDDFSRSLPDNFNDDDAYPYEGEVTLCASCAFPTETGSLRATRAYARSAADDTDKHFA
jgi:hypothetical protein